MEVDYRKSTFFVWLKSYVFKVDAIFCPSICLSLGLCLFVLCSCLLHTFLNCTATFFHSLCLSFSLLLLCCEVIYSSWQCSVCNEYLQDQSFNITSFCRRKKHICVAAQSPIRLYYSLIGSKSFENHQNYAINICLTIFRSSLKMDSPYNCCTVTINISFTSTDENCIMKFTVTSSHCIHDHNHNVWLSILFCLAAVFVV